MKNKIAKQSELVYKGIPVYAGVSIAKAFLFDTEMSVIPEYVVSRGMIPSEITRLEDALIKTRKEIVGIKERVSSDIGVKNADIFEAHILLLEDKVMIENVIKTIERENKNAEYCLNRVVQKYVDAFSKMEDGYLKERISDLKDVYKRILHNLIGEKKQDLSSFDEDVIVLAYDLAPSDTVHIDRKHVVGFATDIGGKTSHTAIMAKSLGIPAVVGLHNVSHKVQTGDTVVIDAANGLVVVNPSEETLEKYRQKIEEINSFESGLNYLQELPAETKDNKKITLSANVEIKEEVDSLDKFGSEGIGLYRTEFFYMNRHKMPTEEDHFKNYKEVVEKVYPNSVIIRTVDLGGDKFFSHFDLPQEMNPFLGWRGIRFCLERLDIFETQLRAILRASAFGNIRLMYPMISSANELRQANEVLNRMKNVLRKENIEFDENIEVGVMIEVPSAAITADDLAKEVDFFSIGTNDLIQYTLAVDRVNEKISHLYEPAHPAVIHLIQKTIEAAHKNNIWVGMCGEMASNPVFVPLLIGLGIDELSVSPVMIPEIKKIIRSMSAEDAKILAGEVMTYSDYNQIQKAAKNSLKKIFPEIIKLSKSGGLDS